MEVAEVNGKALIPPVWDTHDERYVIKPCLVELEQLELTQIPASIKRVMILSPSWLCTMGIY